MSVQDSFDKYIDAYTKLSEVDKKKEIINKLRDLISNYALIGNKLNISHDLLINKELADLNNDPLNEKDFLEGVFVYIHTLEDEVSDIIKHLMSGAYE
ncbi:MAG: hypothetical protein IKF01_00645 [Bacilli bacterium]|nr:hypothetical protein [Bacilli bacterium]